jgi:serine/threonine-protein kinase
MARDSERDTGTGTQEPVDTELELLLRQVAHVSATGVLPVLPRPGEVIDGKYRLIERIGVGGMGAVYSAVHLVTEKAVAVKWLLRPTSDARARRRFLREARIAGRVAHPNLVDVYDVGEVRQSGYLVMELLRGESLRARLARGRLQPHEAVDLLLPAFHGVAAMHAAGVIHRDLKPDNIFLCLNEAGAVERSKVLDFGLSALVSFNATDATLTQDGLFAGTPAYAAPERLQSERDTDERSDIYSLGVILYESLTGQLPIMADSYPALVLAITHGTPEAPSKVCPELTRELDAVVLRALAKQREDRFAAVSSLIAALTPFASTSFSTERSLPRLARARWRRPAAGVAAVCAALGLAGLWLHAASGARPPQLVERREAARDPLALASLVTPASDPA